MTYLVFDYLYRDAGNYKATGSIWLSGALSNDERRSLVAAMDSGEFFIAEQVGVPALCPELFAFTEGPTRDDHTWHEFEGFRREAELTADSTVWGSAAEFLAAFLAVDGAWRPQLSPNFYCAA